MENKYDVVVVGAGPAGASAAKSLVELGRSVLILEKQRLPRDKPCTGVLFGDVDVRVRELFGEIPKECFAQNQFKGYGSKLYLGKGEIAEYPIGVIRKDFDPQKSTTHVWRSKFDHWLVQKSKAKVRDCCKFVGCRTERDSVIVECKDVSGKVEEISAKYLIAADGGDSEIRSYIAPEFAESLTRVCLIQCYYTDSKIERPGPEYITFVPQYAFKEPIFSDFFGWYNERDEYLVIGTSVVAGKKIGPYLDRLTELLKTDLNLKLGPCVRTEGVFLTDMPLKRNYFFGKDRVLMVGEATGIVDCNWVGIGCAVDTGMLAGKAISESIERQKDAVSVYRDMLSLVVRGSEASWAAQKVIKLS